MLSYCGREARVLRRVGGSSGADRPTAASQASLHRAGGRDLPRRIPSVLPARRLSLLARDLARAGRVRPLPVPLRDVRTLTLFVRELGVRHTFRLCALALRGRCMAAAYRRREAPFASAAGADCAARAGHRQREPHTLIPLRAVTLQSRLHAVVQHLGGSLPVLFHRLRILQGPVLLVTSHYPFRQVVGVEFSSELHRSHRRTSAGTRVPHSAARLCTLSAPTPLRSRSRSMPACSISQPIRRTCLRPSAWQLPDRS